MRGSEYMKQKILIVEDEHSIRNFMATVLDANGYESVSATSGQEAFSLLTSGCPDAMILDLGLPDMDGMTIIHKARTWTQLPIIVVSARMHERDKVEALEAGADDYITKPFGTGELIARIRTAIRHSVQRGKENMQEVSNFRAGELFIDYDKYHVYLAGQDVHLTQSEYKLVALLSHYAGKVLTYDYLIRELWGPTAGNDNQILRVNMANIRRKIEKNPGAPEYIFTEVGVGYRMVEGETLNINSRRNIENENRSV